MTTALLADRFPRRFSPLELRCLVESGLFGPDERPVLYDGMIVDAGTFEPRKFTTDDLDRMDALGFFGDDERLELLDGEIYLMAKVNSPHAGAINRLVRLFTHGLGDRASVIVQNPVHLDAVSELQPDLTLARFREDGYDDAHPTPPDIFLAVEVMDSSVRLDHAVKLPLYAQASIPELWLVNLPGAVVEVYRAPEHGVFTEQQKLRRGETVAPAAFPDVTLAVAAILSRVDS